LIKGSEEGRGMARYGTYSRKTKETDIEVEIKLDGTGVYDGFCGYGFFDHMLEELAFHGRFDIRLRAVGDMATGYHHLCEDVGICLGRAFDKAMGSEAMGGASAVERFGWATVPMDGSLARVSLDISGRGGAYVDASGMEEDIEEYVKAFARESGINLHMEVLRRDNAHHATEACFKALALALRAAIRPDPGRSGAPSSKGVIG